MKNKLKILVLFFGFALLASLGLDLILPDNSNLKILNSITAAVSAQEALPGPCPPCGPLMGNRAGTRYYCADTNSDECDAARAGEA